MEYEQGDFTFLETEQELYTKLYRVCVNNKVVWNLLKHQSKSLFSSSECYMLYSILTGFLDCKLTFGLFKTIIEDIRYIAIFGWTSYVKSKINYKV